MTINSKNIITVTIRCLLILLFCYTAINKWLSYNDFMYQLKRSPFIPTGYHFLSFALPVAEIGISVLLSVNTTAKAALAAAAILLFIFTIYIICMLLYAPQVPCSCGGFVSFLSWTQHIILNTVMALLAMIGYKLQPGRKQQLAESY